MNILEVGLSFLEGLALIASPCILPILPLVLGTSVDGGRKRPFGIITGFVISFTAFAMLSRKLVMLSGISSEVVTDGSLILLALFGLVMLSEKLSEKFSGLTQSFANAGNNLSSSVKDGFGSGVMIGMLIGLVWTPCAGPILAAVLVQVIRQESDINALFMIAAFAFGAGVPMLAIALMGRKIMSKLGFFTRHAVAVRKIFGIIILLAVVFIASGGAANLLLLSNSEEQVTTEATGLKDALPEPYSAPEFRNVTAWLNSDPLTMAELRGKVVLIDFWTYSCINCIRTLPYITKWDRDYRDKGLVIIGIHAPEFEFEKNQANVEAAIAKHNIEYPVAMDNSFDNWVAFNNHYWPAHYLIDKDGRVVYTHFGEGNYAETENNIRYLLGLGATADNVPEQVVTSRDQSPETYLGYKRGENFVSPEEVKADEAKVYSAPKFIPNDSWALSGKWTIGEEKSTAENPGASLQYNFVAGKVFLVLGSRDGKPIEARITLNGAPIADSAGKDVKDGVITIDGHTLYELVSANEVKNGLLEITSMTEGLEVYAFTFGR